MGNIADRFASTYRDFETDGVPASGDHEPIKREIRALGPLIESAVALSNMVPQPTAFWGFGDSIMAGANASGAVDHYSPGNHPVGVNAFMSILRRRLGLPLQNFAIGGNELMDQARLYIFRNTPSATTLVIQATGANDEKIKTTAAQHQFLQELEIACDVWLAAQPAVVRAQSGLVARTGTWAATNTDLGDIWAFGLKTNTLNSSLTVEVEGPAVVVGMLVIDPDLYPTTAEYTVTIDGVVKGTFSHTAGDGIVSRQGGGVAPRGLLFEGLGDGSHTVVVKYVTAGAFGIECGFIAGLNYADCSSGALLHVETIAKQKTGGYADGGSDVNTIAINAIKSNVVSKLSDYGCRIKLVDRFSVITDADIDADYIHPLDSGHLKIANAEFASVDVFSVPKLRVTGPDVPTAANSPGTPGDIAWDANYLYVCVSANSWKRTALAAW